MTLPCLFKSGFNLLMISFNPVLTSGWVKNVLNIGVLDLKNMLQ